MLVTMNEHWSPTVDTLVGTLHDRILVALRQDIASGDLEPAGRMPPHRELARRLCISVGTVTRAYAEGERLGLLTSTVGRGTFVAERATARWQPDPLDGLAQPTGMVDLSLNLPSLDMAVPRIAEGIARLPQRPDLADMLSVTPPAGVEWHRQTLAAWFRHSAHFDSLCWQRLLVTTGAQHALSLALETFTNPGDTVLTEAASFSGFRSLAEHRGVQCVGVAMDGEGILPDALEEAILATGSRVLYVLPTVQNPTTRTLSRHRREDIVRIARAHNLTIIEDDVYAPIALALGNDHSDLVPIASLAPERTCYVSSVSKATAMGLRVGILVAPDDATFSRFETAMRANCYSTSSLSALLACQLIKDGAADDIRDAVALEATSRLSLARRLLGDAVEAPSFPTCLHAWLPMPELRAERILNGALRRNVLLTPPSSFIVDGSLISGLRICLNTAPRPEVEYALRAVRSALADELIPAQNAFV